MREFWEEHSHAATVEEMMLDSSADQIELMEREEILGMIDDFTGLDVLELGAGIGRYTSHFASKAKSVRAVDFMESFTSENQARNGHLKNVNITQADVTQLEIEEESFDLIFSNWLMMYLTEVEVLDLFAKMLKWLRPGGKLYFRESCFHQSGDKARTTNPTQYRDPATYTNYFQSPCIQPEATKGYYAFELIFSKFAQTHIKVRYQNIWQL
ncbi:hypothetical protein CAPTEDRAFT_91785 [Capitella teleta]|uniref:phosphoethanolamine N-methyltransferase n=1 Tax=Capitella teleta TaxID=283909 RepID=R7UFI2_CAPTE|nr:hypothetical protein CAPTEDRAFT_91785 [Capitella teleta]|eukprot:ELU02022.1 hypothetical protein CAPTEDRAFT_91785 [Capitella teleta]